MDSFTVYLRGNDSNHWKRRLQKNLLHNIKGNMRGSSFQTVSAGLPSPPEKIREATKKQLNFIPNGYESAAKDNNNYERPRVCTPQVGLQMRACACPRGLAAGPGVLHLAAAGLQEHVSPMLNPRKKERRSGGGGDGGPAVRRSNAALLFMLNAVYHVGGRSDPPAPHLVGCHAAWCHAAWWAAGVDFITLASSFTCPSKLTCCR